MFPSFFIGEKEISLYMIMVVLGGVAVGCMLHFLTKGPEYRRDQWLHILLAGAGGAFIGAHILFFFSRLSAFWQLVTHWSLYIHSFSDVYHAFLMLFGGMIFYGGLFGALVGGIWYCRALKIDAQLHLDAIVPGIPLFHVFGRIGCLLAGCCYGVESAYGWYFPGSPTADPHVRYFPIQLVEAGLNLILFLVLLYVWKRMTAKGRMIWLYLPAYAVMRFVLEFWRGDTVRGIYAGLSTSQWISIIVLLVSLIAWLRIYRQNRTKCI